MRVTIDGTEYVVTPEQVQKAFGIVSSLSKSASQGSLPSLRELIHLARANSEHLVRSLSLAPKRGRTAGSSTFDIKAARKLRDKGKTNPEIAAALKCSVRTVIRQLKGDG